MHGYLCPVISLYKICLEQILASQLGWRDRKARIKTRCSTKLYENFPKNRKCCSLLLLLSPVCPHLRLITEFKSKGKNNQEVFRRVLKYINMLGVEDFPLTTQQFSDPGLFLAFLLNAANLYYQQNETYLFLQIASQFTFPFPEFITWSRNKTTARK